MAKMTFIVSGVDRNGSWRGRSAPAEASIPGHVKQSVRVTAQRASGGDIQVEAVPGEDVVVLHIANGPSLCLHPESARELLAAQHDPATRSGGEAEVEPGKVRVPVRLQWRGEEAMPTRGASRGFLGDVLVEGIDVVTGWAKELITDKAADFVASKVVKQFDERVAEGVYALKADQLVPLKGTAVAEIPATAQPALVLIHGTFSDTAGTFQKLWTEHPAKVRDLFAAHHERVFALDHATLGAHPVSNALTLARALQPGARLHLLTHSRGGLVAEVLARAATMRPQDLGPIDGWTKSQIADLRLLVTMLHDKKVTIERVVRVACPARGTLLASKRLDAYVSGVKWALRLAGVPIAPEFLAFLAEVARRRAEPETLPGLAAQIPDSPLVQWLHTGDSRIPGDLRVVAGDMQGDAVVSWMKTLLSDAFFWTDNDLVVQTRSMYGGTPREANSLYVLNRGGHVSHFNYFANPETATAVVAGLTDSAPGGFKVIGPLSWAGSSATGERGAIVKRSPKAAAALPALVVLPGILGSNLKVGKDRVWLAWRLANGFQRLAFDPASPDTVAHDGPLDLFYENLISFLSNDHDVSSCAFDWRRPIEDSANVLADLVEKLLDERKSTGTPVRLIAHSMGGVVARTMQIVRPKTWKRMMDIAGARLLMLGTPNGGSFAPMQMLSGDDTFGNLLTLVGAPFRGHETRELIAQFPGLLQLQADLLDGLGEEAQWQKLAAEDLATLERASFWHRLPLQLKQARWGIPTQPVLDAAVALRRRLDEQSRKDLPAFADKILLVVGKAAFTPTGYQLTREGLVYLDTPQGGDGRVTLESALLPGVRTWIVDCEHGSLPKKREAFEGYRELLANGDTTRLARLTRAATARSAAAPVALVRSRPARAMFATAPPPEQPSDVLEFAESKGASAQAVPEGGFDVTVVNGDLTFVAEPLILGHYRSSRLSGAEAVMDRAMGGAMSASLQRGRYPEAAGECQVFVNTRQSPDNPWQLPRPRAVIVAGLGAENELRGTDLVRTVRQAAIAWAQRLTELPDPPAAFTIATTLLGSGGSGVTPGQAAQLIAQGVREANVMIAQEQNDGPRWPRVGELRIIELYLSRASEAWQSLCLLAESLPTLYKVHPAIEAGIGRLHRPLEAGYRGADYDFISALVQHDEAEKEQVVYTIDTKRSRSEVRTQGAQLPLIRTLVRKASNSANDDAEIGRTLFRLLVPVDLEAFMASSGATVLELDRGTAPIPWELLDSPLPGSADDRPWAIRSKLLRKLRTSVRGQSLQDASADDNVLVIGDPACDRSAYPALDGARREALAVVRCLSKTSAEQAFGPKVKSLISEEGDCDAEPTMQEVLNAAMAGPWRIIHIAGHGEPPATIDGKVTTRGVVLSDESFLGPDEIRALRFAPELVFVNCCHLATAGSGTLAATNYDRTAFASGVAEALISAGVRCVIAAGWAVDDAAAEAFAEAFYTRLLAGASFIDAVAVARETARSKGGNTWAAYQCYGDPDWHYRPHVIDAQTVTPTLAQEFAAIGSGAALRLALETMAVQSEFQGANPEKQAERLRYLESSTARFWQGSGELAEAFGNAWAKVGKSSEAIDWYERARVMADGTASLAAIEQLANLKVRQAWQTVRSELANDAARTRARKEIADAMLLLDRLLAIGPTIERESIYGSAYKRLAMIEGAAGNAGKEARAIKQMKSHYAAAEEIALTAVKANPAAAVNLFYPAMNRLAADVALGGQAPIDPARFEAVRTSMASVPPDFYSVVGQTELSLYASLLAGTFAKDVKRLTEEFGAHHERLAAAKMWGSVYENATFVLAKYRQRAKPAERGALDVMLSALARFAGQPAPDNQRASRTGIPASRRIPSKQTRAKTKKSRRN